MKKVLKGGTVVGGSGSVGQMCSLTGKRWRQWEPVRKWSAWQMRIPDCGCGKAVCSGVSSTHTPTLTSMWRERLLRTILPQEPGRLFGAAPTTIVDSGPSMKGESLADGPRNWHEKADGKCSCDYGFHMSISD